MEVILMPTGTQREPTLLQLLKGILQTVGIGCHIGKFRQFILSSHLYFLTFNF